MATAVEASLVVAADGRRSLCREAAGIEIDEWRYDQGAIATSFRHSRRHEGVSIELHRENASLTTVPLPDPHGSAMIWVGSTAEIASLMERDNERFADALAERLEGLLGQVESVGPRSFFAVAGLTAKRLAATPHGSRRRGRRTSFRRSAHRVSISACATPARLRIVSPMRLAMPAISAATMCCKLMPARGGSTCSRARSALISSTVRLLTRLVPLQAARGIVLHGLKALPLLRRMVMRVGLAPPSALPSLMRGAQA